MYNNPTQFPLFLTPNPTVNIQQQQQSLPNPPNNNGYHTTNIMPPNIANNANQFTPTIPSYPSQMNQNQMYNAFNTQQLAPNPSNNMHFQPNLYPQSTTVGPPQFVTIVNKATNYITSSPYSLITPQHQHHHPHQHIPPQSQSQAPASPTSSTTSSKTDDTDNDINIDAMLQHFGLTPTPHGDQLWQQCFENITYKHLSVPQTYSHSNQYPYEYEPDCQLDKEAKNKDINISICNKCTEHNTQTLSSKNISAAPFLCSQDYYHNACFHFIFAIEGLGVFQYCNSCFPAKQTHKTNVTVTESKRSAEVQPAPFNLDTYLNNLISQQLDSIHAEHEHTNKTAQRCDIKLSIPELSAHCKQSGMTDSFVQQLKHNHKQNALPHSLIDLPVFSAPAVEVSIHSQAHIHCILYHPKIGCMEFCQYCNKMRSTFCDNPGCLTKASVANVMLEANMDVSNQASFCSALHHLITSNIAPYKQTTLFTDINDTFSPLKSYMDLNKRLNLTMPKPAGPLAPHAMLITNRSHRNRSSSSTSLPKNLSADTNAASTHKTASTKSHKSSDRSHKTTQSASFNQYKQYKHHHHGSRRQFYRYRYNKRRAANFNKLKKGIRKSEFITHNVICVTPTSSYQDSIHSSYEGDKCLSVPPLTPMLRANSANSHPAAALMMSINHGRPYSVHYTHNKVLQNRMNNYVEVANSVRSFDERSDAPSMTPVHSVHNGLNPAWSNPYATGSIGVRNGPHSFNDAASLSSLPMSPTFSYTSLPNFPPSPFVYSTSNISHHSTSSEHHSDLLNPVDGLKQQYLRLNYLLNSNKEMRHSLNIHREKDKNKATRSEEKGKVNVVSREENVDKTLENEQKSSNAATNMNDGTQNNMNAQMRYPMNLINVNSGGNLQTAPLQLQPPFIPLSTVPQYYTATNQAPLMGSNRMSSLGQLPQNIQLQLRQQGLPQNALILPIDQMENFKKMFAANKNNANFMANLNNGNVRDANFGNNMNNNGGSKLHRNARR